MDDPQLDHASVSGTVERILGAEVTMRCENGYNSLPVGDEVKMKCTDGNDEAGDWQADGECKSLLAHFI